jgi:Short-chain dehydrogenases of various substrate specificities
MQNKTAVITGASSGIGAAYARKFAQMDYDLLITGRREDVISAVAQEIRDTFHVGVEIVLAELSQKEGVQKVIDHMQGRQVDVLINNAGFGVNSLYQDSDLALMERLASVNIFAPMELIRAALPGMLERRSGTIINVSSEAVSMIMPRNSVYTASKAYLKYFTEALHLDLMHTGVRVMAVCPGLTHSDFHNKMGLNPSRQKDHGPVKWMQAEQVVDLSLKDLQKNKVVSIPGHTKMLARLLNTLPRNAYYNFMYDFSVKNFRRAEQQ